MTIDDGELRIRPVAITDQQPGSPWLRDLYDYYAPVRQEATDNGHTEDEINADIAAAVSAVRKQHG